MFKFVSKEGSCTCHANHTTVKKINHNKCVCMKHYYVATKTNSQRATDFSSVFLSLLCMYVSLPDRLWSHTANISLVGL